MSWNKRYMTKEEFFRLLDVHEIDIFTLKGIEKSIGKSLGDVKAIVHKLVRNGLLVRIEGGKYCRHNFRDELVIGNYLISDGVIAYWTALNKHGLTEQFSNTVFVQTTKNKQSKQIFGIQYKFIRVIARKLTGYDIQGYGNRQYRMTDVEKTIVDCFDLPQYSGGYAELIRAFENAEMDEKKLITYCKAVQNIAATKRMGYLAELLGKENMDDFISYAKSVVNPKYNLFDPAGSAKGKYVNEWKLRLNISRDEILEICNKVY